MSVSHVNIVNKELLHDLARKAELTIRLTPEKVKHVAQEIEIALTIYYNETTLAQPKLKRTLFFCRKLERLVKNQLRIIDSQTFKTQLSLNLSSSTRASVSQDVYSILKQPSIFAAHDIVRLVVAVLRPLVGLAATSRQASALITALHTGCSDQVDASPSRLSVVPVPTWLTADLAWGVPGIHPRFSSEVRAIQARQALFARSAISFPDWPAGLHDIARVALIALQHLGKLTQIALHRAAAVRPTRYSPAKGNLFRSLSSPFQQLHGRIYTVNNIKPPADESRPTSKQRDTVPDGPAMLWTRELFRLVALQPMEERLAAPLRSLAEYSAKKRDGIADHIREVRQQEIRKIDALERLAKAAHEGTQLETFDLPEPKRKQSFRRRGAHKRLFDF